jgi:chaperonin GroEL
MSSTPKEIIFEEEARDLLVKGIVKLADAVSFTLGPKGRNVGLEKSYGAPKITNDGRSIVDEITLENQYENMGVSIAKEVVEKVKNKAGDGTTTVTLLLKSLVENGTRLIASGASPIALKRGLDKATHALLEEIEKKAIPIKGDKEIRDIAKAAASGNEEIGDLIGDAMKKVSTSGVVTIEEGKGTETIVELEEGMQFDRGYISAYFCTNQEKMTVEMDSPSLLLIDKKLSNIHEILPILQTVATTGKELLIIAEDIEGDLLSTLVVNRLRGSLKVAAVKAPGFGDKRKALLQDIAILTGAQVVSEEAGISLNEINDEMLGSSQKVVITKESTLIVTGQKNTRLVNERIKQIEYEIEHSDNSYDKEKLLERKAKLSGGVAVIKVGAATEPELKQKKQLFEDSLNATKAALEEGIVPGGGVALLRASQVIPHLNLIGDEALGGQLLQKASEAPLRQIAVNSGKEGSVIVSEVLQKGETFGFNVLTETIEDLLKAGVIDPAKVVKQVLRHAVSAAGIVLLSEALIGDAEEEKEI